MNVKTKIKKWGNSLAIRLPEEIAKELDLHDESAVEIKNLGKEIRIKPEKTRKKLTLKELVSQITPENRHPEIYWGPDVGREILEPWS